MVVFICSFSNTVMPILCHAPRVKLNAPRARDTPAGGGGNQVMTQPDLCLAAQGASQGLSKPSYKLQSRKGPNVLRTKDTMHAAGHARRQQACAPASAPACQSQMVCGGWLQKSGACQPSSPPGT